MNAGVILFLIFAVCVLIGVPISMSLGIGSLAAVALGNLGVSPAVIAQRVFGGLQSTSIMAIAFFILAGNLMAGGGISRRRPRDIPACRCRKHIPHQTAAHRRPPRCPTRWPAVRSHIHSAGRGCAGPDIPHSMQPAAKMPPTPRPAPPADAAPCGPSGFFLPYRPLSIILSTKIPVRYGRHAAAPPVPRHPARPRRPCGGTRSAAAWRSCWRPV